MCSEFLDAETIQADFSRLAVASEVDAVLEVSPKTIGAKGLYPKGTDQQFKVHLPLYMAHRMPRPLISAILAHELGHFTIDRTKARRTQRASRALALVLASAVAIALHRGGGTTMLWHGELVFLVAFAPCFVVARMVELSVYRRHEFQADDHAAKLVGPAQMAEALGGWVLGVPPVIRIVSTCWWALGLSTHPRGSARIRRLREQAAR